MPTKESGFPEDWFKIGDQDLKAAEILIRENSLKVASFHLQQAVEKYLKGYLLSKGWKLQRTHDLELLLDFAIEFDKDFEDFRDLCQITTEYYIDERYPIFLDSELTHEELLSNLNKIKDMMRIIKLT